MKVSGQFRAPALFTRRKYLLELNKKLGGRIEMRSGRPGKEKKYVPAGLRISGLSTRSPILKKKRHSYLVRNLCGRCSRADAGALLGKTAMPVGKLGKLRIAAVSFVTSASNNSFPTGRVFVKFDTSIFRKSIEKIQMSLKSDRNNRYCTGRPMYIFDHISSNSSS
jgi:hypothetical protein